MARRLITAAAAALLVPALAVAVPRPPEPRLHPQDTSAVPSYVRRVEPAIVGLHVTAAEQAPSSRRLGKQRFATGVVFDGRGYAVTVTYALTDAVTVSARLRDGRTVPARVVGLDLDSGLGVVKLEGEGPWTTAHLGDSRDMTAGAITGTVGVDEDNDLVHVTGSLQAIRRFSSFWEYMLRRAFLVSPSSPSWGGSALVNDRGEVVGVVSLRIGEPPHVNVAIPLETFVPVSAELIAAGRVVSRPPRPWLGLYTTAADGRVYVEGFSESGPAGAAGFRRGDQIVRVDGVPVATQEEFYEELWRKRAGDVIRVAVVRDSGERVIAVRSIDRHTLFRLSRP
jgi:S1-C subfamily serine protease